MDLIHERAAGIDISKRVAKVAIQAPGKRAGTFITKVTTWGATTNQILALRDMLAAERVTTVVMEATSDYWKPFFYLFEDTLPVSAHVCPNELVHGSKRRKPGAGWVGARRQ